MPLPGRGIRRRDAELKHNRRGTLNPAPTDKDGKSTVASQSRASHNPGARSSGKAGNNRAPLSVARLAAIRFAKCLGLPHSFRNLYIIELAIDAESNFSQVTIARAAAIIMDGAIAARESGECVNYFWFEDCGWRHPKLSYKERDEMRFHIRYRGL